MYLRPLREVSQSERLRIINDDLQAPILKILATHGVLRIPAVQYFLEHEHDIIIDDGSVRSALQSYENHQLVKKIQLGKEWGYNMVYCLPEDVDRAPEVPVYNNYEHAFIDLYLRYQGIRQHPELATAPEGYLIDLFNPRSADDEDES